MVGGVPVGGGGNGLGIPNGNVGVDVTWLVPVGAVSCGVASGVVSVVVTVSDVDSVVVSISDVGSVVS